MSYLSAINKARNAILADNEEPLDILISESVKHALLREVSPIYYQRTDAKYEWLMGMKIEWQKPRPLTMPQITIRTAKGDTRIVTMLDGSEPQGGSQ